MQKPEQQVDVQPYPSAREPRKQRVEWASSTDAEAEEGNVYRRDAPERLAL